jgi:hypothetical protein
VQSAIIIVVVVRMIKVFECYCRIVSKGGRENMETGGVRWVKKKGWGGGGGGVGSGEFYLGVSGVVLVECLLSLLGVFGEDSNATLIDFLLSILGVLRIDSEATFIESVFCVES